MSLTQDDFVWQVLGLRLAIIACHARGDVDPGALDLKRSGSQAVLALPPGWAASHPRTLHLLRAEVDAWRRLGVIGLTLKA